MVMIGSLNLPRYVVPVMGIERITNHGPTPTDAQRDIDSSISVTTYAN
jgi:hypothetical protein